MQQLMSEQDFCRKAIIETSEILRELTHMQYVSRCCNFLNSKFDTIISVASVFIFQSIKLNEYLFL